MAVVTEDEIIRRRLLFDGDGKGDDKMLTTILKTIVKWSMAECDDEERTVTYQKIIALLHQCEYSIMKHHLAYLMNIQERENYEKLYEQIKQQIIEAKQDIQKCKEELQHAKVVRRNKQEYDSLAKIIEKQPERKTTEREISVLEKDISELDLKKKSLLQKLEMRQKQFHVLIYSVQLLQQILEEDDKAPVSDNDNKEKSTEKKGSSVEIMDLT